MISPLSTKMKTMIASNWSKLKPIPLPPFSPQPINKSRLPSQSPMAPSWKPKWNCVAIPTTPPYGPWRKKSGRKGNSSSPTPMARNRLSNWSGGSTDPGFKSKCPTINSTPARISKLTSEQSTSKIQRNNQSTSSIPPKLTENGPSPTSNTTSPSSTNSNSPSGPNWTTRTRPSKTKRNAGALALMEASSKIKPSPYTTCPTPWLFPDRTTGMRRPTNPFSCRSCSNLKPTCYTRVNSE